MLPPVDTQAGNSTPSPSSSFPLGTHGPEVTPVAITTAKHPVEPYDTLEDPRDPQLSPSLSLDVQRDDGGGVPGESLSRVLIGSHKGVSPSLEPNVGPAEDFYPTNTMEVDWGSGDYVETMSYMGSEGDDYALVTNLPSDMYDFEDSNSEVYDSAFPTRAALLPSGTLLTRFPQESSKAPELQVTRSPARASPVQPVMYMTRSPSFTSPDQYDVGVSSSPSSRATSVLPSSPAPTVLHSSPSVPSPPSQPGSVPSLDTTAWPTAPPAFMEPFTNSSNVNLSSPPLSQPPAGSPVSSQDSASSNLVPDWSDGVTIEPTDLLLPDMNSLEFFTIQQTKEPSRVPGLGWSPTSPASHPPITPTPTLATGGITVGPTRLFTASFGEDLLPAHNSSWPEESSSDTSGFEPPIFPTSEPDQTSHPFLDPSMVLTPSMEPSVSTTGWGQGGGSGWMSTPSILTVPVNTTPLHTHSQSSTSTQGQWDTPPTVSETLPNGTSLWPPSTSPSAPVSVSSESSQADSNTTTSFPSATSAPPPPRPSGPSGTSPPPRTDMADEAVTVGPPPPTTATEDSLTTTDINTSTASPNRTSPTTAILTTSSDPFVLTTVPGAPTKPAVATTVRPPETTTVREYLCNITKPENYLIKVGKTHLPHIL